MDGTLANLPLNVMWKKWETSYEEDGQRFVLAGIWLDYQKQELNEKWIVYGVKNSGKKKKKKTTMKAAMKTMKAMKQKKNMKAMKQKKVVEKVKFTKRDLKRMHKMQHQKWRHI